MQLSIAGHISFNPCFCVMLNAIDFYDYAMRKTGEIDDVSFNRALAAEVIALSSELA